MLEKKKRTSKNVSELREVRTRDLEGKVGLSLVGNANILYFVLNVLEL